MDLIDKVIHIQILDVHTQDFDELGKDVEIEFIMLDGPLAGHHLHTKFDDATKILYLEKSNN